MKQDSMQGRRKENSENHDERAQGNSSVASQEDVHQTETGVGPKDLGSL